MPDDNDRLSVLNSPWLQLGVPLAAMAATAIAPRHAGPAARVGMYGFQGLNDVHSQNMRISQANAEMKAKQEAEQKKIDDYHRTVTALGLPDGNPAEAPGIRAPEGGDTPEATSSVQAATLESTGTPVSRPKYDPRISQVLQTMDPDQGYQIIVDMMKRSQERAEGNTVEDVQGLNIAPGTQVSGVPLSMGGTASREVPQMQLFQGQEGGREQVSGVDKYTGKRMSQVDIGQTPPQKADQPEHAVTVKNGKKFMQYVTPKGITAEVELGPADSDTEGLKASFDQKAWILANGKQTGDAEFDAAIGGQAGAKEYLESRQNAAMQLYRSLGLLGDSSGVAGPTPGN